MIDLFFDKTQQTNSTILLLILIQTWCDVVNELSYGPSIGVPESPELVDEILSRRLNYKNSKNRQNNANAKKSK